MKKKNLRSDSPPYQNLHGCFGLDISDRSNTIPKSDITIPNNNDPNKPSRWRRPRLTGRRGVGSTDSAVRCVPDTAHGELPADPSDSVQHACDSSAGAKESKGLEELSSNRTFTLSGHALADYCMLIPRRWCREGLAPVAGSVQCTADCKPAMRAIYTTNPIHYPRFATLWSKQPTSAVGHEAAGPSDDLILQLKMGKWKRFGIEGEFYVLDHKLIDSRQRVVRPGG